MGKHERDAATFYYEELAGLFGERWSTDDAAGVIAALESWRLAEREAAPRCGGLHRKCDVADGPHHRCQAGECYCECRCSTVEGSTPCGACGRWDWPKDQRG